MPGKVRKGKGNPRKSDLNPNRVAKLKAHHDKLKSKRIKQAKERKESADCWKNNKQWQKVDKPKLMKRLKEQARLRRKLRREGKLCACLRKNVTHLVIVKGETLEKCTFCNKPITIENFR